MQQPTERPLKENTNTVYSSYRWYVLNPHLPAPSGLPTPQNLRVIHSTNSSVTLVWDLPPPPVEVITNFKVSISCTTYLHDIQTHTHMQLKTIKLRGVCTAVYKGV